MSDFNQTQAAEAAFDTTPDTDARPILAEGQYGLNGEATLYAVEGRLHTHGPNSKNPGAKTPWVCFSVGVQTEDKGLLFVRTSPWTRPHTKWLADSGGKATAFLKALDLFPPQFGPANQEGHRPIEGVNGMKVIVDVGIDRSDDGSERNFIRGIERRP